MLTSIGIGAPPASFSDAKTAAANQKAAVGGLTTTVSGLNTSLSLLSATGAPASVTGPLKTNLTSANALMTNASSMTPAELTKKTAAIQSQHNIDMMNHANVSRNEDIAELTAAEKTVTKVIKPILADKKTSQKIRNDCAKLLADIKAAKTKISAAKFTTKEAFVVAAGSKRPATTTAKKAAPAKKGTPLVYIRPNVLTPEDIDIRINIIQDDYDDETDNNLRKLSRNTTSLYYKYVWPAIFFTLFTFCVVIAGIISSNACLPTELYSVYNRAFYFIYGAILFPITLPMYGIIYPPEWYSTICPLFSNDGSGPVVADELDGPASLSTSAASALSSLTSFFGRGGAEVGGDGTAALVPPVAPTVADNKPTLKGATYYFYPLVADATSKSTLSKMSLVATILVWGYLISIGGIALLSKL